MRKVYEEENRGKEKIHNTGTSNGTGTSHGTWCVQTVVEFPEFLFFEEDDRVDKNAGLPIVQFSEEASELIFSLTNANHTIPMSRGIIRNNKAHVTEGPLVGYDDRIVKVDRHKRLAWVKMDESGVGKYF